MLHHGLRMMVPASSSLTYATWNSADKGANITLSNSNKTATGGTGSWQTVRANQGKTTGKHYWEMGYTVGSSSLAGISDSSVTTSSPIGGDARGLGVQVTTGELVFGATTGNAVSSFSTADVIGYALDADARTLKVYLNNVLSNTYSLPSFVGAIYPAVSFIENGANFTANFGATAMAYSPPAGYNAGVYT